MPHKKHWGRVGASLDDLTVLPLGHNTTHPLDVPGHWRGYIICSHVRTVTDPHDDPDEVVTEPGL